MHPKNAGSNPVTLHQDCMNEDIVERLQKRAEIRRQILTRKSVQEGQPDRLADLLDEAANEIKQLRVTQVTKIDL